jgi:hypothetical protein
MPSDTITGLRALNPVIAEPDRGKEPVAQAALQRILEASAPQPTSPPRRGMTPRGLVLVLAVLLVGVGGALAAADPMGWWSTNPSEAHYRVSTTVRVSTPTARQIRCRADGRGHFSCAAETDRCYQIGQQPPFCKLSGRGLPYTKIDTIHARPRNSILSRAGFERAISKGLAARTMTEVQAAQIRSDLARVPDSFFTEMRLANRYGTYGAGGPTRHGKVLVPPAGQPTMLVCNQTAARINCQNINGDTAAPIGAGVYAAIQQKNWRWVNAPRYTGGLPPGIHFTHAEDQVLIDLLRFGTTTSQSSGSGHATTIPITHLHAAPTRTTHQK